MTSPQTHDYTVKEFKQENYFGYEPSSFVFFQQAELPVLSEEGKILLNSETSLSMSPNGNGAFFEAINSNYQVR